MNAEEISAIRLSLQVAAVSVAMSLPCGILVAYVLARKKFLGRSILQGIVDLPLVLPPVVTGYLLLRLFSTGNFLGAFLANWNIRITFGWLGAVIASAVVSFPLLVRPIRVAIQSVDRQFENTSLSLGVGSIRTFFRVLLPMSMPGILTGCVLAFARSLGEFGATIMLAGNIPGVTQTLPLAIYSQTQRVGGFDNAWKLVAMSVALSLTALLASEFLNRRWGLCKDE